MTDKRLWRYLPWVVGLLVSRVAADDVLTQHNDNARTGVNSAETKLTVANVTPTSFGRLWDLYADGQIVAQPLYVSGLTVDTPTAKGTFNAVVIATMHNTVYVYDADQENRYPDGKNKPLWARWLGPGRPSDKAIDMWSTNDPEWGILGTPVIDPEKTTIWVVAWHSEDNVLRYRLHALDLKTGNELRESTIVGGAPTDPQNPCKYPGGYNPCKQKQRMALLLDKGVIYAGFGGDGSRGAMFAYDAKTLKQVGFWSVTPKGDDGGLWQSGQGPAADGDGNVYVITGNGTLDAPTGGPNYGEALVRLRLEGDAIVPKDFFAPCNAVFLNSIDLDFGSGGPILIPNSNYVFGGGKEGILYLLPRNKLGGHEPGYNRECSNPNVLQEFQATDLHVHGAGTVYGHVHGSPVFWAAPDYGRAYVWGENDHLKQYDFKKNRFVADKPTTSIFKPPDGMPGGMLSLSVNGAKPGTSVLWGVVPRNGDANRSRGVQGLLVAVDARDVSKQLWTSELAGQRDSLGLYAKFVPPTIAGGKVFVATYGNTEALRVWGGNAKPQTFPARYSVVVYGQLVKKPPAKPIKDEVDIDLTLLKARATEKVALDLAACLPQANGLLDCTAALEQKYGAPSIHTLTVPRDQDFASCNLLRVYTASRADAFVASGGIGWYAADATAGSQAMTSGRFITPNRLKQVGTGVLTEQLGKGVTALIHEYIGVANCTVGDASADKLFKPYMQFDNSPDVTWRKWDLAPWTANQNYRVSRAQPTLDFTTKVLQP